MPLLAKLRWRCRRGTLELDVMLMRYLDTYYASARLEEQALFEALLAFEDDILISLLLGNGTASTTDIQVLADIIRNTANGTT
jgi:antitoxin CptB